MLGAGADSTAYSIAYVGEVLEVVTWSIVDGAGFPSARAKLCRRLCNFGPGLGLHIDISEEPAYTPEQENDGYAINSY